MFTSIAAAMAFRNIVVNKEKVPCSEDLLKTLNSRLIEEVARLRKEIKDLQAVSAGVYNVSNIPLSETAQPSSATHPSHFDASAGLLTSLSLGTTHPKTSSASAQKLAKIKRYKGKERAINFCIKTDSYKVPKEDKDCLKSVGTDSDEVSFCEPAVGVDEDTELEFHGVGDKAPATRKAEPHSGEALASDDHDVPNSEEIIVIKFTQGHKLAEDNNKCPESSSLALVSNPPELASVSQMKLLVAIEVDNLNVGQEMAEDGNAVKNYHFSDGMPEDENHIKCSEVLDDHITTLQERSVTCSIDEYGCTDASIQQLELGDEQAQVNLAVGFIDDEDRQEQGSAGIDREIAATDVLRRGNGKLSARKMLRWISHLRSSSELRRL